MTAYQKVLDAMSEADRATVEGAVKRIVDRNVTDTKNRMRLVKEVRAGPLRLEACEFEGKITYTMCFDNDVMAHMGESAAKLFANFVLGNDLPVPKTPDLPAVDPF